MIKKNSENKTVVKVGPVEMGLRPFVVLVTGIVVVIFILKSGYDINIGNWSCSGKPADVKVNFQKNVVPE